MKALILTLLLSAADPNWVEVAAWLDTNVAPQHQAINTLDPNECACLQAIHRRWGKDNFIQYALAMKKINRGQHCVHRVWPKRKLKEAAKAAERWVEDE